MTKNPNEYLGALQHALNFIGSEAKGFVHNLSNEATAQRYKQMNAIISARNNADARRIGFPGGVQQWNREIWGATPQKPVRNSEEIGRIISGIYNSIKNIL